MKGMNADKKATKVHVYV